jgi:hypothetical protein
MQRGYYFGAVLLLLGVSLVAAAILEERIVGTWEERMIDAISRIQFRRDHTMLTTVDSKIMSRGKWQIDGDTLIIAEQWTASPRRSPRQHRATIFELSRNRLITGEQRPAVTFTRVR